MTFLNSVMGGFGVAAGVVTVLAISNGLSTYIFDGQTITQKVDARLGSGGIARSHYHDLQQMVFLTTLDWQSDFRLASRSSEALRLPSSRLSVRGDFVSQGVRYTLVESNATDVPIAAAAANFNRGMNIPGGAVDEVVVRFTLTGVTAGDIDADFPNLINSCRLILNGETVFDFVAGYSAATQNSPSTLGYLLNSLGPGRSLELCDTGTTTAKEAYLRIPVGRNIAPGISRLEYSIGFNALANAATSGTVQWWIRYNPAMQTTTTVGAATTATYANTTQQVVCRVPQNVPGTLAGVLIQNDATTDTDITDIRVVSQSDFAMDIDMWRVLNGDLYNGIKFADDDFLVANGYLTFAQFCSGSVFLPLYQLSLADDLRMQVTATTAGTLSITPVITSPIAGKPAPAQVQTESVPTNVAKSVLTSSGASN